MAIVPSATEAESEIDEHFSAHGIALNGARAISFKGIGIVGTPTVALVSSDGIVAATWVGKLSPEKEAQMVERIFSLCKECTSGDDRGK